MRKKISFSKFEKVILKEILRLNPSSPYCYSNCDQLLRELIHWLFELITKNQKNVSKYFVSLLWSRLPH